MFRPQFLLCVTPSVRSKYFKRDYFKVVKFKLGLPSKNKDSRAFMCKIIDFVRESKRTSNGSLPHPHVNITNNDLKLFLICAFFPNAELKSYSVKFFKTLTQILQQLSLFFPEISLVYTRCEKSPLAGIFFGQRLRLTN